MLHARFVVNCLRMQYLPGVKLNLKVQQSFVTCLPPLSLNTVTEDWWDTMSRSVTACCWQKHTQELSQ